MNGWLEEQILKARELDINLTLTTQYIMSEFYVFEGNMMIKAQQVCLYQYR